MALQDHWILYAGSRHLLLNLIITSVRGLGLSKHPILSSCILMTRTVPSNLIASSKPISRDRARTPSCFLTLSCLQVTYPVLVLPFDGDDALLFFPFLPLESILCRARLCKNFTEEFADLVCDCQWILRCMCYMYRVEYRMPLIL